MTTGGSRSRGALALGSVASLAVLLLYVPWIAEPHLRYDDFDFLTRSRTWHDTWTNLLRPMNEHVMPMARLSAGVLMSFTPRQSTIAGAAQFHGVLAVVIGMWLLYAFVRRELGHPFYAVIAMTLWGVTSTYYECVTWYSASFFTLALDTTLLALLAAQAFARTGRAGWLGTCAVCAAAAPAFHSTALPAGLWCALYLLHALRGQFGVGPWKSIALAATPLLGTLAGVTASFYVATDQIVRASHYRGKTIFGAFDPLAGLENTLRTLADNQIPGVFGFWHKTWIVPWPAVLASTAALAVLAAIWWRRTSDRRLLWLGLAILLVSDVMVYSARADWSYERTVHNWTRYHLFPHLGLVLFVVGGLPRFAGRWFALVPDRLSGPQTIALLALLAAAVACHWPRTHRSHIFFPSQVALMERVERVDAACRRFGIGGPTAREALPFVKFPLGYERDNVWEFLRGSPAPIPVTVEDARARLQAVK